MTVPVQETINRSTGNGVTTVFPYSFFLLSPADLIVTVAGVVMATGFTVSGVGSQAGGNVTFTVAPANGASVVLERIIKLERLTDYQQNGDFLANVVNPDFDRIWMAHQQHKTALDRAIKIPIGDVSINTTLPVAADRANNLLGFDSNGNPVAVAPAAQSASALQALLALFSGASLLGWIQSGAGAVLRLVQDKLRENISVKDFGAIGDNVADDTAAINAAYASVGTRGGTIFWPAGTYKTSASIIVKSNTTTVFDNGAAIDPVTLASFAPIVMPTYTFGYALFRNENFTTAAFDTNITYIGVRIIPSRKGLAWYGGVAWNGHGIDSRHVKNLKIINGYAENMGDFTACLNCIDVVVEGNYAKNISNSAYDFWEGCGNVVVRNNFAYNSNNGCNWNACDTQNAGTFLAFGVVIDGNHFEGGEAACIFVSPLTATTNCQNIKIINNTLDQVNLVGSFTPSGIVVQRSNNVLIEGNTLYRIGLGRVPIQVTADAWGDSYNASILNNDIMSCAVGGAGYIAAFGSNHHIAGNKSDGSSTTFYAVVVDSPSSIVGPNNLLGAASYVGNQTSVGVPTTPAFEQTVDKVNNRWYFRQAIYAANGMNIPISYGVTALGTNIATAFQIVNPYTYVSGVAAGTGVKMPAATTANVGKEHIIWNQGGASLTVYGNTGDTIGGAASVALASGAKLRLICVTPTLWMPAV